MSWNTVLAFTVAAAVLVAIAAHVLDQMEAASALTRVGVRLAAVTYIAFVVFTRFAEAF